MTLRDFCHFDFRIVGTVTMFFPEPFSSVHLKRNHFISLHMAKNFGFDHLLIVFADGKFSFCSRQYHVFKFHFVPRLPINAGNKQSLVFFNPELASCDLNDCEHTMQY